jgi:hypothetical protein
MSDNTNWNKVYVSWEEWTLKDLRGIIHADGYAGFNELFAAGT